MSACLPRRRSSTPSHAPAWSSARSRLRPTRAELDAWHRRHAAGRPPDDDLAFYRGLLDGPGTVLELGVGAGRVATAFAAAGHLVVGVDRHLDALPRPGQGVLGVVADMAAFAFSVRFDLVVIADNTLALLDGADRADCLATVAAHLAPSGLLAFEVADHQAGTDVDEVDDVPVAEADGITLVAGLSQDRAGRTTHYRRHFHGDGWAYADELAIRSFDAAAAGAAVTSAGLGLRSLTVDGHRCRVVASL